MPLSCAQKSFKRRDVSQGRHQLSTWTGTLVRKSIGLSCLTPHGREASIWLRSITPLALCCELESHLEVLYIKTMFWREHIREDSCLLSLFNVWEETFTGAALARDEKAFVGKILLRIKTFGRGCWGHLDKVPVYDGMCQWWTLIETSRQLSWFYS